MRLVGKTKAPPVNSGNVIEASPQDAEIGNIRIHSVRLPGYVASQEIILGDTGHSLKIRHDSIDRESFMPGIVLAIRKIKSVNGLVYGLEKL